MDKRKLILGPILLGAVLCVTGVHAQQGEPAPVEIEVPEPGFANDILPTWESHAPPFPYMDGEDKKLSRSIGDVSNGYLVNAAQIPSPHPHMAILPIQNKRRLNFTTQQMLKLIEDGAKHVDSQFPGSILYLGNFSAEGGGDIPYSVSHNSGRDGDIAFFSLDREGNPIEPPNLLPFDENGEFVSEDGTEYYKFDVPRNWAFIEGILDSDATVIQYVFISNPLRSMLLEHAKEKGVDPGVIAVAETVLWEPNGALPHNDHFHIRIYCNEHDVAAGCKNTGRRQPGFEGYYSARSDSVRAAKSALESADAETRAHGLRRLAIMGDGGAWKTIVKSLEDENPLVRAAAVRALSDLGKGEKAVAKRLDVETHPAVRVEIIAALGTLKGKESVAALSKALDSPRVSTIAGITELDERAIVSDALLKLEDARAVKSLVASVQDAGDDVRGRMIRSLRVLTNQPIEKPEEWATWYEENKKKKRKNWLVSGFKDAGFEVKRINMRNVWDLCRAIQGPDHVSHNAQRELMKLAKRDVPSLNWSKDDAYFYWRRWFERRYRRYGAPPIPEELSTLKGEKK